MYNLINFECVSTNLGLYITIRYLYLKEAIKIMKAIKLLGICFLIYALVFANMQIYSFADEIQQENAINSTVEKTDINENSSLEEKQVVIDSNIPLQPVNTQLYKEARAANPLLNFPDEKFRKEIVTSPVILNNRPDPVTGNSPEVDGYLIYESDLTNKIQTLTHLGVNGKGIQDLTGIQYFTKLTTLHVQQNQITNLDLSSNTNLVYVNCERNQITELNVSNSTNLMTLNCNKNQLTSLDVSANPSLLWLDFDNNNLTSIDLSNNSQLTYLFFNNNELSEIDLSNLTNLQTLYTNSNNLSNLDLSNNKELDLLACYMNNLSKLDLSENKKLTWLKCSENRLTSLDLSEQSYLTNIDTLTQDNGSIKLKSNESGDYIIDLNQISGLEGGEAFDISRVTSTNADSYDSSTGIAKYSKRPTKLVYSYNLMVPKGPDGSDTLKVMERINISLEVQEFAVSFVDWDGQLINKSLVVWGGSAIPPESPTREGYTFTGWDKAFSNVSEDITVTAQYEKNITKYAVKVINGTSDKETAIEGEIVTITADSAQSDKVFDKWSGPEGVTFESINSTITSFTMPANAVTVTAIYKDSSPTGGGGGSGSGGGGGGSSYDYYTITASADNSGDISPSGKVSIREGLDKSFVITPKEGFSIKKVLVDGKSVGAVTSYTFKDVRSNHKIEAFFIKTGELYPNLNKQDHFAYIYGYPSGVFLPESNMTRAEVIVMFSRLLNEKMPSGETYSSSFKDVNGEQWYSNEVGYMEKYNIISGYPDGTFGGERSITRAEFATIVTRFDEFTSDLSNEFLDINEEHWAYKYISFATRRGWILGYPDNTVRPENFITRAEVVTSVNRILERDCDKEYVKVNKALIKNYFDLENSHWAYYNICEASNQHEYKKDLTNEIWTSIK